MIRGMAQRIWARENLRVAGAVAIGDALSLPCGQFTFQPAFATRAQLDRPRESALLDQLVNLGSLEAAELRQIGESNDPI